MPRLPAVSNPLNLEAYYDDPTGWATSLANVAEVMLPCIEATEPRSVAEVGAYAGDLTRLLVDWAAAQDRTVTVMAIDPSPQDALVTLDAERPELELIRETSLDALPRIDVPDVVIIDGDHNYWTVSEELRIIAERAPGKKLPLILLHDVEWPHARRDDYFAAEQIPADHRQPLAGEGKGIYPGDPGLRTGGLPYPRSAEREGGPGNGVRTAVEDFVATDAGLRFATVPAFFGFGVVWHGDRKWAKRVAQVLEPWDDSQLVGRLEAGRVAHLAAEQTLLTEVFQARERRARQEAVLQRLLDSSAFAVAERLSRLRERVGIATAQSLVSKDEIRRALRDN